MTILPVVTATLSEDRKAFTLRARTVSVEWVGTYDIRELAGWITFYRRQRDARNGKFREYYDRSVKALEHVWKEAQA